MLNFGSNKIEKKNKIQIIKRLLENGYTLQTIEKEKLFDSKTLFVYLKNNANQFRNMHFRRNSK
ncbi:hypothetical protein [Fusobacterium sp. IOR10]|uniref:hypothetical protein n=1 Tax=Fusobacterium sp. IOR10 TaxID=2665157 RepID=UPI0013CFFC7D|nr:hypothetical protein [Fusobacterium sp. IOR10]